MTKYKYVWCVWYRSPTSNKIENETFEIEEVATRFRDIKIAKGCKDVGMNRRIVYL